MNNIIDLKAKQEEAFFESDIWDLTTYPNKEVSEFFRKKHLKYRTLDFSKVTSEKKEQNLKYILKLFFKEK